MKIFYDQIFAFLVMFVCCFFLCDLQVYVEFDDQEWEKREWVKVYEDFQLFLLEYQLVWAKRKEGAGAGGACGGVGGMIQGTKAKHIQWPALVRVLYISVPFLPVYVVDPLTVFSFFLFFFVEVILKCVSQYFSFVHKSLNTDHRRQQSWILLMYHYLNEITWSNLQLCNFTFIIYYVYIIITV